MSKPSLNITGQHEGPPSVDDLIALFKKLTGREPDPADVADLRKAEKPR